MNQLRIAFLFLALVSLQNLQAQMELGLHSMPGVWNANQTNPAFVPEHKITIGLIGLRDNLYLTGPTYNDFLTRENGENFIDFDKAIAAMDDQNLVRNDFTLETLSAAVRVNEQLMLSVGHATKVFAFANYAKGLPQVIYQGNAQFIGETVDLDNEFVLNSYNEFALGAAYDFGLLTVGAKAKYLSGFRGAATDASRNQASLFTDEDIYQITLNSNYRLNSSGIVDFNGFDEFDAEFDLDNIGSEFFTSNTGWAFDLGITAQLNEKLTVSASVLDVGSIEWTEEVKNYTSNGTFTYDGLDISDALMSDEEDPDFGNALDTLESIFKAVETSNNFSIDLPRKLYLSGQYTITDKLTVGAVYFAEKFRDDNFQAISLNGRYQANRFFSVGATYATFLEKEKHFNLGINAVVNLGPVQIFGATDNVIALFDIDNTSFFSGRMGINLQFGHFAENDEIEEENGSEQTGAKPRFF